MTQRWRTMIVSNRQKLFHIRIDGNHNPHSHPIDINPRATTIRNRIRGLPQSAIASEAYRIRGLYRIRNRIQGATKSASESRGLRTPGRFQPEHNYSNCPEDVLTTKYHPVLFRVVYGIVEVGEDRWKTFPSPVLFHNLHLIVHSYSSTAFLNAAA